MVLVVIGPDPRFLRPMRLWHSKEIQNKPFKAELFPLPEPKKRHAVYKIQQPKVNFRLLKHHLCHPPGQDHPHNPGHSFKSFFKHLLHPANKHD